MSLTDLDVTSWSAARMASLVRAREVSPEVVVMAHLERIERLDSGIGAFQLVRVDQSLNEARQLSERADLGKLPLAGVPVAVKDNIDVASEPTRLGSAATSTAPARDDDELVRRLRSAGCIIIGKTKMPELAIWPFSESGTLGDTRNPWDTSRTAGGSTSGGAAAVAARMVPLALGSDGGGSIRVPAACCGIVGLKPGPGLVPIAGGSNEHWFGMTEFGPLARTTKDLALMLDVLSGAPGERQPTRSGTLRIAVSIKPLAPGARVDTEVKDAVKRISGLLAEAGHTIVNVDPPYPMTIGVKFSRYWLTGIAEDAEGLSPDRLEKRTRDMARTGRWIHRRGWGGAARDDAFGAKMRQWFGDFDVLVTPTIAEPAVPIDRWQGKGWIATTLGVGNWVFTTPWNVARLPAASIPVGMSARGLPIGLQAIAREGGEDTLLALMAQIEQLKPWPTYTG